MRACALSARPCKGYGEACQRSTGQRVIPLAEAARQLRLSPATLRQQIAAGRLAAVRQGRDWYVSAEAIDAYRAKHLRAAYSKEVPS